VHTREAAVIAYRGDGLACGVDASARIRGDPLEQSGRHSEARHRGGGARALEHEHAGMDGRVECERVAPTEQIAQ
jgi:hypothetical protein